MNMNKVIQNRLLQLKEIRRKKSIRNYISLVSVTFLMQPIAIIKNFIVARYLGPADFGLIKSVELIQMLNKFGNLGFVSVAQREIGTANGQKDSEKANRIRNAAYSGEILLSVLLTISGIVSSFFFEGTTIKILIILASLGLFFAKVSHIYDAEATVQKKFKIISNVNLIHGLIVAVLTASLVAFFNVYIVLISPIIASIIGLIFYYKRIHAKYRFTIDFSEIKKILSVSIFFSLATLSYGSYRYAERILVLTTMGTIELGIYGFASMLADQLITVFLVAVKVRKMYVYEALGRGDLKFAHRIVIKETILLLVIGILAAASLAFIIPYLIEWFLPKWVPAIFASQLFLLVIPFKIITSYAAIVTTSPLVNKIKQVPIYQVSATVFLVLSALLLHYLGKLTLINFILLDILGYALYHLSYLTMYYKYFIRQHLT
jgi:O-antigen/teichoic acid export membrane protein